MIGPRPIVRRRRARRALFVVIILLFLMGVLVWQLRPVSTLFGNRSATVPTPCPDPIACHALKRMQPTAVTQ